MRSCTYPIVVLDTCGADGRRTRPKRTPGARGSVVAVRRAGGIRYVARVVEYGRARDVPGGARATRAEAERALEIALAITRPCGVPTYGAEVLCYWHAKVATPPEANGHASSSAGWQQLDLAAAASLDAREHRPAAPLPRCVICGVPTPRSGTARACAEPPRAPGVAPAQARHEPAGGPERPTSASA
jgi:hypothetical protein